jgi:hypothetical protein
MPIKRLLWMTEATFWLGWTSHEREAHCDALSLANLVTEDWSTLWDVVELSPGVNWMAGYGTCGLGRGCDESVEVDSKCHHYSDVNYVFFGVIERLCCRAGYQGHSRAAMGAKVEWYRNLTYGGAKYAHAWAVAGYDGWHNDTAASPPAAYPNCARCGEEYGTARAEQNCFHAVWDGVRIGFYPSKV